jgi:hypothetical protein
MRNSGIWMAVLLLALASPPRGATPGQLPMMSSIEPASGKIGDVITVRGSYLGKDTVAALYLTDGTIDTKVTIVQQSADAIQFKIPAGVKPGRLALMVLTSGTDPKLIEEPVKITVESDTTG